MPVPCGEHRQASRDEPSHPLRPEIDRFEAELARHLEDEAFPGRGTRTVHADLKVGPMPGGGWRVAALYWSLQCRSRNGFTAGTLSYKAHHGKFTWLDFPDDPRLPGLAEFLAQSGEAQVLRYIPLRRVTLRVREPSGRTVVAKLKGASRFRSAWELLRLVEERVARAQPGFRVPKALGIEEGRCLFFQEALPGRNVAELLDADNAATMLARMGELHRRLHALPADGLARRAAVQDAAQAQEHAALIGLMLPALRDEGVLPGQVQVTPDGRAIVLGVDGPTTGGYPKIAAVIAADLAALGQLRPWDRVRFARVEAGFARSEWERVRAIVAPTRGPG